MIDLLNAARFVASQARNINAFTDVVKGEKCSEKSSLHEYTGHHRTPGTKDITIRQ